ncbi:hypothetical protein FK535_27660 [Mycolicibacterium sp. 018/SC-01/001]|uniref:hypothetical protein n=1 Tax=Mycolicibacterium sp. 018/SC-01/001 TaxID=2592069 RepID=UPI00117E0C13|nr:hypothetical protein [Mycolicibacterium sp. 018/SC-01/001]TRW76537.1 hypothetical protein FK535_27660 [Mycolicibacterium sp. 018/SC-01/001]
MGRHRLATQRRPRWAVPAAALAVPALSLLCSGADSVHSPDATPAEMSAAASSTASLVTGTPSIADYRSVPADEGLTLARSRSMHRTLDAALPSTIGSEAGMQVKTILVARAVSAIFPEIQNIGGVRPDSLRWHPDGLAVDVMIPDYASPEGIALGNAIAAFAVSNADRLGVAHVIWRQTLYPAHGTPHGMTDLGSDNANHYNHVHIATVGGGYPGSPGVYLG